MQAPADSGRRLAPILIAALAAVPLLSLGPDFERGLRVEAAAILVVLAAGWWGSGAPLLRPGLGHWPRPVRLALGAWAVAAGWGAVVGLASGNPLRNVASQTLAMLLLPLGAAVLARLQPSAFSMTAGLTLGLLGALAVRGLAASGPGAVAFLDDRLRIGAASLADGGTLMLALGLGLAGARRGRAFGWLAASVGGVVVVAGLSRGQWLATAVAVLAFGALVLPASRRRAVLVAGSIAGLAVLGVLVWLCRGDIEPLHAAGADTGTAALEAMAGGAGTPIATLALGDRAALAMAGRMRAAPGDRCTVWTVARSAGGVQVGRSFATVVGAGTAVPFAVVFVRPSPAVTLHVGLTARRGRCVLETVSLGAVARPAAAWCRGLAGLPVTVEGEDAAPADGLGSALGRRVRRLASALRAPEGDVTVGYRLAEQRALAARWRAASPLRFALGHGLGATVPFANRSWDEEGRAVIAAEASYLHNAYAALGFKLGWMGLVAVVALVVVLVALARATRTSGERSIAAAAAACWLAYLVWSAVSPQVLNFRIAPLLGALLAVALANRR